MPVPFQFKAPRGYVLALVATAAAALLRLALTPVLGEQAIEAAGAWRPDVALLDIGMPKRNGYQAATHIRQQPWGKGMVLVAVTGWGQDEDRRRTLEAGFDHHLVKPVQPLTLIKLLDELDPALR